MKKKLVLGVLLFFNGFSSNAFSIDRRGEIQYVTNQVQIDQSQENKSTMLGSKRWQTATKGQEIFVGNNIRTGLKSIAQISYDDGTITRVGSRSLITINDRKLNLKRGYIWGKVDKNTTKGLKIITSNAVASIIGTEFFIEASQDGFTTLTVLEGSVELTGKKGKVQVTEGTYSVVDKEGNVGDPAVFDKDKVIQRYSDIVISID